MPGGFRVTAAGPQAAVGGRRPSRTWAVLAPKPAISYGGSPFSWTDGVAIDAAAVTSTGGAVTSYSASGLPTGVTVNAATGALSGTPSGVASGTATITATGPGGTGTASVSWSVASASTPFDTTGFVDWWEMGEASSAARVGSFASLSLTNNNGVTRSSAGGPAGQNVSQFAAASSQNLSKASTAALQTGDIDFTIAAWVYLDSTPVVAAIACKGDGLTNDEWILRFLSSRFRFTTFASEVPATVVANTFGAPSTGAWIFVVAWRVAGDDTIHIQINNGTADDAAGNVVAAGAGNFRVGTVGDASAGFFDGRIGPVLYCKRLLTANEKTWLYNGGAGRVYADLANYDGG